MKISKNELIEEIESQLQAIGKIGNLTLDIPKTIALLDLQFRLKCKLYELTNDLEGEKDV